MPIALLGGAALTTLVAWGTVFRSGPSWEFGERSRSRRELLASEGSGMLRVERFDRTGATFFEAFVMPSSTVSTSSFLSGGSLPPEGIPEELVPADLQRWVIPWNSVDWLPAKSINATYVEARGWPLRALACDYAMANPAPGKFVAAARGGIELGPKIVTRGSWIGGGYPRTLPLRPLWLGFAIDTVIYGAVFLALVRGVRALRRSRRRRAGRCVACGYDRAGNSSEPCPECGSPAEETPIPAAL